MLDNWLPDKRKIRAGNVVKLPSVFARKRAVEVRPFEAHETKGARALS